MGILVTGRRWIRLDERRAMEDGTGDRVVSGRRPNDGREETINDKKMQQL